MRIWVGVGALILSVVALYFVFAPDMIYSETPEGTRLDWTPRDIGWAVSLFAYSTCLWLATFRLGLGKLRGLVAAILLGGLLYWLYAVGVVALRDGFGLSLILAGASVPIFGFPAILAFVLVVRSVPSKEPVKEIAGAA
jgi:hypothetical protein